MFEEQLIVLVTDDPVTHQIIRTNVESLGFTFHGMPANQDFMGVILAKQPTLVLVDMNQPEVTGCECCTELLKNPLTATVPIIVLISLDLPDSLTEAFKQGATDFIAKPFRNEELQARIKNQVTLVSAKRQLEQEILIKQKLFSLISHDLRSPFTSIIGVMQLLLSEYSSMKDQDRQEFLQALLDNSQEHLQLLDNLMYWSRGQSDRIPVNLNPLPLTVVVKSVFEALEPMAISKSIKMSCQIPADLQVRADSELTRVILKNLIHNSLKYCLPQSFVQVYVRPESNPGGMLRLIVEDNGPGMNAQRQTTSTFSFESSPGTAGEKGAGIGLNISQALARRQGGFLRIIKSDPSGTEMGLELQTITH